MEEQGEERRFTMVPVFVVLLDEDGGPAQVTGGNNVEVSDQVVAQAVAAATEESGAISGLNPRYLQDTDRGGGRTAGSPLPIWAGRPTHCGR